jgi:hypothetical protein
MRTVLLLGILVAALAAGAGQARAGTLVVNFDIFDVQLSAVGFSLPAVDRTASAGGLTIALTGVDEDGVQLGSVAPSVILGLNLGTDVQLLNPNGFNARLQGPVAFRQQGSALASLDGQRLQVNSDLFRTSLRIDLGCDGSFCPALLTIVNGNQPLSFVDTLTGPASLLLSNLAFPGTAFLRGAFSGRFENAVGTPIDLAVNFRGRELARGFVPEPAAPLTLALLALAVARIAAGTRRRRLGSLRAG